MAIYPTSAVAYGQTSPDVKTLQNFLISQGISIPAGATGYFGDQTKTALTQWQNSQGITGAGIGTNWGPQSIAKASSTGGQSNAYTGQITQSAAPPVQNQSNAYTGQITQSAAPPVQNQVNTSGIKKPLDPAILSQITSNLGPNMQNDPAQVKVLQQALVNAGYMNQADIDAQGTAYNYGPLTTAAVAAWQKANGIPTSGNDGYFGPVSKYFVQNGKNPESNTPINPNLTKDDTDPIITDASLKDIIPDAVANSSAANLMDEAYKNIIPSLDPKSPEYKALMDQVDSSYFDVLQQQMDASTEQEQQAAQYNWENLKKYIETNLNVTLSGNALQAWDQMQTIKSQYGTQGIEGSGIQNESIDDYLKKVRLTDMSARNESQTKEESNQEDYYRKFATPAKIKELIASNPQKAQEWGLIPSADIKNTMSFSSLKAKYPTMSDDQINSYIASVLDENGNYRSNLYQTYMTGNSLGANYANVSTQNDQYGNPISSIVTPSDIGKLDIDQAKNQNLNEQVDVQNVINQQAKSAEFNMPTVGSSSSGGADTTLFNTLPQNTGTSAAASAASNLGTGTVPPVNTTPTPTIKPATTTTPTPVATTTTNPTFMTNEEMFGGATGLAAWQKRVTPLLNK